MKQGWDTIVVGAGLGGLTAAVRLARAGLRVLVLDRNSHAGGTAFVYRRRGFVFPMGPLGFSHPDTVLEIFGNLGLAGGIPLSQVRYRLRAFGLDLPLSLPFPEMSKELSLRFPSESAAIAGFFSRIGSLLLSPGSKAAKISSAAYLSGLTGNPALRRILGSLGTAEPYSGLPLLAAMWDLMGNRGIWYPREGFEPFCLRFASGVTGGRPSLTPELRSGEAGWTGRIRLGAEVARIHVTGGKARGVILRDGSEVDAASVISNADFKTTFLRLVLPGDIPHAWRRAVDRARQTGSILQVCLGVEEGAVDLSAFSKAHRLIYRRGGAEALPTEAVDWSAPEIDPRRLAGQEIELSLWGDDGDRIAPPGGRVIVLRTEAPHGHFTRFRLPGGGRLPSYGEYKARLAAGLMEEAEKLLPGLRNAMRVVDVATPLTFEDQGGRSEGAVAGWSWDYGDLPDDQPRELVRTPIERLYMAGYQAFSGLFLGGVPTAVETGFRAAGAVLAGAAPVDEIGIPLPRDEPFSAP